VITNDKDRKIVTSVTR